MSPCRQDRSTGGARQRTFEPKWGRCSGLWSRTFGDVRRQPQVLEFSMFAMKAISSLSLVHRFLLVGFCVLVAAMVFIGTWVGTQIQSGIMNGMGVMTDLYLDGAIAPHLQSLANGRSLEAADRIALDRKLASTHLGEHIVVLKIWGLDGRIIFNSADPSLAIGSGSAKRPPASAFAGEVSSRIVDPRELESVFKERQRSRLIETY